MEDSSCVAHNGAGVAYYEFSCIRPSLGRFYLDFEKYYDPVPMLNWMQDRPMLPLAACLTYIALIVLGRRYFQNRPAWSARGLLALWNIFLSTFSFIGTIRTWPQLIHNLTTQDLRDNFCMDPQTSYGSGSTGLWVQLFVLSKFPELIDTLFIVIHKKPLIFLHWYHHITVLLYCWHSYVTTSPPGIFFVVMNYTVHWLMYGYYALMALRLRPKWFNPMVITSLQISQMVIGVAVTVLGFYYYYFTDSQTCALESENNFAAMLMYGSYLALFLQFFVGRYSAKNSKKKKKAA